MVTPGERGLWVAPTRAHQKTSRFRVGELGDQNPADIGFRSVSLWRRGEELPGPGHALELMFASFSEFEVGSSDEFLDCA
jgi:hypothetical protein